MERPKSKQSCHSHVIDPKLVVDRNVNDEVAVPPNVDVHEHQISPPNFPVALRHRGDVAPLVTANGNRTQNSRAGALTPCAIGTGAVIGHRPPGAPTRAGLGASTGIEPKTPRQGSLTPCAIGTGVNGILRF